jgi:hypothetical protein
LGRGGRVAGQMLDNDEVQLYSNGKIRGVCQSCPATMTSNLFQRILEKWVDAVEPKCVCIVIIRLPVEMTSQITANPECNNP